LGGIEFEYPMNIMYILILIASIIISVIGYRKKERIIKYLKIHILDKNKIAGIVLLSTGILMVCFSLLGPKAFKGYTEVNKRGLDIYFLIDTSRSMLVEDIKPDRISRAKKVIEKLIDNLEGDRIGYIPFSSAAYIQMPLTDDYELAKMFLNVIDTDMIGGGGTNIGTAISLAAKSFEKASNADRVIIILSDGEEHESGSLNKLKAVNDDKLRVYTIGTGTDKGGLIPVYSAEGSEKTGYKKDNNGEFIMSKLSPEVLKELASAGNGLYFQSSLAGEEITAISAEISKLKRDILKTEKIRRFKHLYQIFLGAGILLIMLSYILPDRRINR
jgi:Ca-activated chloride channel family protein